MTAFDYAVLAVIAASALLGLWRGVVGEVLALAAWVVAFFVARAEALEVAGWLAGRIAEPGMRLAAAYVLIFVGVLLIFALARMLISLMLKAVGLGLLDRLLGGAFGVLRGILVVLVAVLVAGVKRGGLLLSLLVLPMYLPTLIFGAEVVKRGAAGLAVETPLALLAAITLAAAALLPFAAAAAIRVNLR